MNDVKITDKPDGALLVYAPHHHVPTELAPWLVAALRAHFAAEQPGRALVQEALDVAHSRSVPLGADAVWHYGALLDKVAGLLTEALAAEHPATPTPSEVIDWIEQAASPIHYTKLNQGTFKAVVIDKAREQFVPSEGVES